MAKSGLTHIDVGPELTRTEWESEETHALINGTSFPGSPVERQLFYRNDLHEWYIYTGSAWASLQGAGGGLVVHDNAFHSPDYEEEGVAATQIETHRTTAVHAADQPPDVHDNAKHSPDFEEEGVAATQIETHRTAAEHTQDQPSTFLKLSDTPAAFTGQAGKYPKVNVGETALEFDTPGGAGDMLKSVYDTDDDGVVDNSEKLEGSTKTEVQTHNPAEHGNEAHDPDFASAAALSSHQATVNAHAAAVAATANRITLRDASGRAKFAAPAVAGEPLIKGTPITDTEHGSRGSALHADSHAQNTDTDLSPAHKDAATGVHGAAGNTLWHGGLTNIVGKTHLSQAFGASSLRLLAWNFTPKQGAIFNVSHAATSPFSGVINGNPTATAVVYDGEANENCLYGVQVGANRWGRFILHNTTRSNSRLVVAWDIDTNTITTESSTDDWADDDVITLQSQTCVTAGYMDVDLSDELDADEVVAYVHVDILDKSDAPQSGRRVIIHPYETYDAGKRIMITAALAIEFSALAALLPIVSQKFCVYFDDWTDHACQISVLATLEYADT